MNNLKLFVVKGPEGPIFLSKIYLLDFLTPNKNHCVHWILPIKNEMSNRLTLTLTEVVKIKIQHNFPNYLGAM